MPMQLHGDLIAEPLVHHWSAVPYMIWPQTCAAMLAEKYLPIMASFIEDPSLHEEACRSPQLRGGPFLDLPHHMVPRIRSLMDDIVRSAAPLLKLHADLRALDRLIAEQAKGDALECLYADVPEGLRGLVELNYDLHDRPGVRLIEPVLYRRLFDPSAQQMLMSMGRAEDRTFVGSTPRLAGEDDFLVSLPFSDPAWDALFSRTLRAEDVKELAQRLSIPAQRRRDFESLFVEQRPSPHGDPEFEGPGTRVRYFGHACVMLQSRTTSVLVDPFIATGAQFDVTKYTFDDLPERIDYVLLTHGHSDHVVIETLLRLRHRVGTVVVPRSNSGALIDPSLKHLLRLLGFRNVVELPEFETIAIDGGRITTLPFLGEHGDLAIHSKASYHVRMGDRAAMFVADSNTLETRLYDHIVDEVGATDALFVGMECVGSPVSWIYGQFRAKAYPRNHDNNRRLNGSDAGKAFEITRKLGVSSAFVYAMSLEPWQQHINTGVNGHDPASPLVVEPARFVDRCRAKGIHSQKLYGCATWSV